MGLLRNTSSHRATRGRGQSAAELLTLLKTAAMWWGLWAGAYNKWLTDNGCRKDTPPGLVLVSGGFRFKQTDGSGHWASTQPLSDALQGVSALNRKLRQLTSSRDIFLQQRVPNECPCVSLGRGSAFPETLSWKQCASLINERWEERMYNLFHGSINTAEQYVFNIVMHHESRHRDLITFKTENIHNSCSVCLTVHCIFLMTEVGMDLNGRLI